MKKNFNISKTSKDFIKILKELMNCREKRCKILQKSSKMSVAVNPMKNLMRP